MGCRYSAWRDTSRRVARRQLAVAATAEGTGRGRSRRVPVFAACSAVGPTARRRAATRRPQNAAHGPFFPQCGGVSDQTISELTRVTGLVNTANNSVGCQWLAGGGILGPHFSFTWYRGSPIGRERKTEELSRASVEDINIEGHDGFIALGERSDAGHQPVRDRHPVRGRLHRMVDQLRREAVPRRVRRRQGTDPPVDCELQMSGPARASWRVWSPRWPVLTC